MQSASFTIGHVKPVRLRSPRGGLVVGDRYFRPGVFLPESARPALEVVAAKAAVVAKVEPVVIGVAGFSYRVRPVDIDASVGTIAFHLSDVARNRSYFVHRDNSGEVMCDCPDFIHRRQGTGEPCKHGLRLAELGLIASTTPRTLPTFADRPRPIASSIPTLSYRRRFEPTPDEQREAATLFAGRMFR